MGIPADDHDVPSDPEVSEWRSHALWFLILAIALAVTLVVVPVVVPKWIPLSPFDIISVLAILLPLEAAMWATIVTISARRTDREGSRPRELSGCSTLSSDVLRDYYSKETPLWQSKSRRAAHTLLVDRSSALASPDTVVLSPDPSRRYRLPPEFRLLGRVLSAEYARKRVEYRARDKVGIVTGIRQEEDKIIIGIEQGRLEDEYATSQNPEMDYARTVWFPGNSVSSGSVREYFSPSVTGRLPEFDERAHSRRRAALRLAAHLVLLLPANPGTPWRDRKFILQVRPGKGAVATGAGELTSTMSSGMDYRDAWSRQADRHARANGHGLFTNYALRELRYEVLIFPEDLQKLAVAAITRDVERLGQPVVILLGEVKPESEGETPDPDATFDALVQRWHDSTGTLKRVRYFFHGQAGRERWELRTMRSFKIGEIDRLMDDDRVMTPTKACLYFLQQDRVRDLWESVPRWNPYDTSRSVGH